MPALQKYWLRPSMIVFTATEPIGASTNWDLGSASYLYLSDDSREPVQVSFERIETRNRMIDGTMRSYFIADKRTFSTSWSDFPSRKAPSTDSLNRGYGTKFIGDSSLTNIAAGQELLNWYNTYKKDFWMLLVYDAPILSASINIAPTSGWAEKIHVFFEDFNFTVTKRGQYHDLWNVDMTLVEA